MLSDRLLAFVAEQYDFDRETPRFMAAGREASREFYSFAKYGSFYVCRFIKSGVDGIGQIRAEMDWLSYLSGKGVRVMRPLRADNGELVVLAEENGEPYSISACGMVEGNPWDKNNPELWNEKVFFQWGKVMGDMHRETKNFAPADGAEIRREYTHMIGDSVRAFPSINKAAEKLACEIAALPRDGDAYGLIHYDLGPNNFLIDGALITAIDFDDCAYAWHALDIGVALYLGLWFGRRNDSGQDFTNDMIEYFLKGYLSANRLDDFWLSKIPMFMRLCQIAKFSFAYDSEDPDDGHQKERMRNIENNMLFTGCVVDDSIFSNPRSTKQEE